MSAEQSKLRQQAEQEQTSAQVQNTLNHGEVKEFATVDDLLRYDSEQNPVPGEVAERLGKSLEAEPKPELPWYKKLFG
jgi:hypothetical protein